MHKHGTLKQVLTLALMTLTPIWTAQAQDFAPRDECSANPAAGAFYARLKAAVATRDTDALLALASPDILLDFGGGSGREELRSRLTDKVYDLWGELDKLVTLGCAFDGEEDVTLPWSFAQDMGNRDPYSTYVALGDSVPLYAGPEDDNVERTLNWQAVEVIEDDAEDGADQSGSVGPRYPDRWKVRLDDGTQGFVDIFQVRSLVDFRLIADSYGGNGYQITALVAGD